MAKKRYYLAYGSNLNMEQMGYRCPDAFPVGTAEIQGYRLLFKGSQSGSYLTIEKADGFTVPVGVWAVTEQDEVNLDRYEGFPQFYYKKEIEDIAYTGILSGSERKARAFVYIMHEDRALGAPTQRYVNTCAKGYRNFDFDLEPLMRAVQYSLEEC